VTSPLCCPPICIKSAGIGSPQKKKKVPNVCMEQEMMLVAQRQPCVQAFTRMVKVWKQGCAGQSWCLGYERRTAYYTAYRQVYRQDYHTVYKCCSGWSQLNGEAGSVCSYGVCFNGGRCREGSTQLCDCPAGFNGPSCQYDVNECEETNGGCEALCCNTIGSFYCRCPTGLKLNQDGKTCQDIDECQVHNGGCQHRCVNTRGSYYCECQMGSRLHVDGRTCLLQNPCAEHNGGCMHRCRADGGNAHCDCRAGFILAEDGRTCQVEWYHSTNYAFYSLSYSFFFLDIDDCGNNNGGCSHHCQHSNSGPVCTCNQGYRLHEDLKTCVDVDECGQQSSCCQQNCANYPGGYECYCSAGYRLSSDGCSCDVLDNAVEALYSGGATELPLIRPRLTLLHDYSQPLERYDDYEDDEGELRAESNLSEKFVCLDDTFGNDCSLTCEDCSNGGKCNAWKNGCDCLDGWTGIICNQSEKTHTHTYTHTHTHTHTRTHAHTHARARILSNYAFF
uniref:Multiple EGF like domains 6 n=1 Tax=Hippocampus comes TaxID=109280 RepID=A0A3Q3EB07_HIPCM